MTGAAGYSQTGQKEPAVARGKRALTREVGCIGSAQERVAHHLLPGPGYRIERDFHGPLERLGPTS